MENSTPSLAPTSGQWTHTNTEDEHNGLPKVYGRNQREIAEVHGADNMEREANAAFIVRACNSHRDLLRELRVAVKFFAVIPEEERRAAEDILHQALMVENMQAVIAAAETR